MEIYASRTLTRLGGHFRRPFLPKTPKLPQFSSISLKSRWVRGISTKSDVNDWNPTPGEKINGPRDLSFTDEGPAWTAVLLGWLGAEQKHLRKYAEIYGSRGMRTISFVVPVGELMADLGKGIEARIARFAAELADWVEGEEDGRGRRLFFHTFSNTGWFTYGAILESLGARKGILQKIRGCVVDSGADPEINPQVWAAGFSAALFKKRGSSALALEEFSAAGNEGHKASAHQDLTELVVLSLLEKIFSIILRLPDVNRRVSRIISTLSKEQPPCPQLYLYSSADRVIPVKSVEMFIEMQKRIGQEVYAHDFRLSPHVDHLRAFPLMYSSKLHEFLEACTAKQI